MSQVNLRKLRKSLGLSQIVLSARIGIAQGYISEIEAGKKPMSDEVRFKLEETFGVDEVNKWIVDGPQNNEKKESNRIEVKSVPLYSLDVVAGFSANEETTSSIEKLIPWEGSRDGDFAVHVTGDSMQPAIPDGALVLLRPAPFGDIFDIEFGKVHAVCIDDDRTLLKKIKSDNSNPSNLILVSLNEDYPPISIPMKSIRRLFLAKSVKYDI